MKNIFILGDSYSTFEGCIPQGNITYYDKNSKEEFGIADKNDTWWGIVSAKLNQNIICNDSYSGTTICYSGYDLKTSKQTSFLYRMKKRIEAGYFDGWHMDTLFVFGGTNDSSAKAPIGEFDYEGTEAEMYNFCPALNELLKMLKGYFSQTRIVFILNCNIAKAVTASVEKGCEINGIELLKLHDIEKVNGHPTKKGMTQIAEQVIDFL